MRAVIAKFASGIIPVESDGQVLSVQINPILR